MGQARLLRVCTTTNTDRDVIAIARHTKRVPSVCKSFCCDTGANGPRTLSHDQAFAAVEKSLLRAKAEVCESSTSNEQFNAWLKRSLTDLYMMTTETAQGPY